MTNTAILHTALGYRAVGLSVIPIASGSKKAAGTWKQYQKQIVPEDELTKRFQSIYFGTLPDRIGVVCGPVSGNLEVIDFDVAGMDYPAWKRLVREKSPELLGKLLIERTPRGGYHVAYRSSNIGRSKGLAYRFLFDDEKKEHVWKATIETRAEGGYCCVTPSEGYNLIQGDWTQLPEIADSERNILIAAAESIDTKPKRETAVRQESVFTDRPGDLFNADPQTPRCIFEMLQRHGWTLSNENATQWFLKHPGNTSAEHSTTLSKTNGFLHTFSPNTSFVQDKNTPPFEVFTTLETHGDFTLAASKLAQRGFVQTLPNADLTRILAHMENGLAEARNHNPASDFQLLHNLYGTRHHEFTGWKIFSDSQHDRDGDMWQRTVYFDSHSGKFVVHFEVFHGSTAQNLRTAVVWSYANVHEVLHCLFYESPFVVSETVRDRLYQVGCDVKIYWQSMNLDSAEYVSLPTEHLPEVLREYVDQAAASMGCDVSFVVNPLLAALSASVGNTRQVELKPDWREPAILWAISVAPSGGNKSAPFNAVKAFFDNAEDAADQKYEDDHKKYVAAMLEYERDKKTYMKHSDTTLPPIEPERPHRIQYVLGDATAEATMDALRHNPRGVGLMRDELSGFFHSFGQYKKGDADSAFWLECYQAGRYTVNRKMSNRHVTIKRCSVSISGTIQPSTLQRFLSGGEAAENGMLQRFLISNPPESPFKWMEARIEPAVRNRVQSLFDALQAFAFDDKKDNFTPQIFELDDDAKQIFIAEYNRYGSEKVSLPPVPKSFWAKCPGHLARLALVRHCVKLASTPAVEDWCADGNTAVWNVRDYLIDGKTMQSASCLMRWYATETMRAYSRLGYSGTVRDDHFEQQIKNLFLKIGGAATKRELERADATLTKDWQKFETLIEQGLVVVEETNRTKRYKLAGWEA